MAEKASGGEENSAKPMGEACEEKARLLDLYMSASTAMCLAVNRLRPAGHGALFQRALANSEAARAECAKARRAFRAHVESHGC